MLHSQVGLRICIVGFRGKGNRKKRDVSRDVLRDVLRMMLFVRLAGVLLILKELKPSSHPQKKIVLITKSIPGPHYSNMQSIQRCFSFYIRK